MSVARLRLWKRGTFNMPGIFIESHKNVSSRRPLTFEGITINSYKLSFHAAILDLELPRTSIIHKNGLLQENVLQRTGVPLDLRAAAMKVDLIDLRPSKSSRLACKSPSTKFI